MKNYDNSNFNEFEREFEGDFETDILNSELEDDFELSDEVSSDDFEMENDEESDFLSEFEQDEEESLDFRNENGYNNNERYDNQDRAFENRFYELFTNNYESEMEFENGFNEIIHDMEQDYFWKGFKKLGSKALKFAMPLAQKALKNIPGGEKYAGLLQSLTSDPRSFLRNAIKTLGPTALNALAPGAGSVLGAVMNSEVSVPSGKAKQAAKDTVALAKQAYSGFANNVAKLPPTNNAGQLKNNLANAAKSAVQTAVNHVKQRAKSRYDGRQKRVIQIKPNSIVSVHPDRVVIWEL
jgi:hypothetical protein